FGRRKIANVRSKEEDRFPFVIQVVERREAFKIIAAKPRAFQPREFPVEIGDERVERILGNINGDVLKSGFVPKKMPEQNLCLEAVARSKFYKLEWRAFPAKIVENRFLIFLQDFIFAGREIIFL